MDRTKCPDGDTFVKWMEELAPKIKIEKNTLVLSLVLMLKRKKNMIGSLHPEHHFGSLLLLTPPSTKLYICSV